MQCVLISFRSRVVPPFCTCTYYGKKVYEREGQEVEFIAVGRKQGRDWGGRGKEIHDSGGSTW